MQWWMLLSKARLILQLPKFGALLLRLFQDERVSLGLKIAAIVGAVLVVSPLDVFGDVPLIGPLDDAALLMLLANLFVRICPQDVVAQHRFAVGLDRAARDLAPTMKNVTPG